MRLGSRPGADKAWPGLPDFVEILTKSRIEKERKQFQSKELETNSPKAP